MSNLGELFERGLGVAKNKDKAKKLYLKAQKAGNTYSSIPLYFIYDKEKKPQRANSYAKKAYKILSKESEAQIKNNSGFASCRAGQILLTKEAGPINKVKAKKFFSWGKNRFNDPCCIKELEKLEKTK